MIRPCTGKDIDAISTVINDAARAYHGVIPDDRYQEPYMPVAMVAAEISDGVIFLGHQAGAELTGVMGYQDRGTVRLIRHAYVRSGERGRGIGSALIRRIIDESHRPLLVGTWAQASRAVRFYERHGFRLVENRMKDSLLRRYWSIPDRQIDLSVVLVDATFDSVEETATR